MTTGTKKEAKSSKLAIIKTGGKQFVVEEGKIIKIEKLDVKEVKDGKVSFDQILLKSDGKDVEIGTPVLKGTVDGEIVEEGRDKKIMVIHYKAKSRYFKKNGHRQPFMRVKITKIS
jgi:large subunit ribosomal protein L21